MKTGFKSYVSVSFQDDTSTLTAVGDAEAKFKDSKSNTDYDFSVSTCEWEANSFPAHRIRRHSLLRHPSTFAQKQATAHVPGVDVYVKCPQ